MFRTLFSIAIAMTPFVIANDNVSVYPLLPPYPCKYVANVFDVRQPGVTCPYFDPFLQSYHYGPPVAADVFYHNYDYTVKRSVYDRQHYMNAQLQYNHNIQNMNLNNEYEFYKQSPWGTPPGFEFYYNNQKDWMKYTQTVQNNQLEYFQNQENSRLGFGSSSSSGSNEP